MFFILREGKIFIGYWLDMEVYTTSLCRSGRDPEKYFDIGMVRLNQMGIMGSQIFWQSISFKNNAYLQAYPFAI